jgi:hypothetical protein
MARVEGCNGGSFCGGDFFRTAKTPVVINMSSSRATAAVATNRPAFGFPAIISATLRCPHSVWVFEALLSLETLIQKEYGVQAPVKPRPVPHCPRNRTPLALRPPCGEYQRSLSHA